MFWQNQKNDTPQAQEPKSFQFLHDQLVTHAEAIEKLVRRVTTLEGAFNQMAMNVNASLHNFNAQVNQCLASSNQINDQVAKNLEIFRECAVRMQLLQSLPPQADFAKRMDQVEKMTQFVLKGAVDSARSEGGTVTYLRPVGH